MGHVYVVEGDNGMVKIGASKNPDRRISEVLVKAKCKSLRSYVSKDISNHFEIEAIVLNNFKNDDSNGEWVDSDFDTIVIFVGKKIDEIGFKDEEFEAAKRLKTSVIVKISKSVWYNFRLVAELNGKKKDEAFQEAIVDYNKKHRELDTNKLMEGT